MKLISSLSIVILFHVPANVTLSAEFELKDTVEKHMDILYRERIVGRYMYEYDSSSKERLQETYKPFLHVFDAKGKAPITKGAGGRYTHHRGLFIGWSKIDLAGTRYDRWHMKGGEQVHQKFLRVSDGEKAILTSLVNWNDNDEKPFIEEKRTITFLKPPRGAYVLLNFTSSLKALTGDLNMVGDPEHAGVQYRPADEIEATKTMYLYPKKKCRPQEGLRFSLGWRDLHPGW